MRELDSFIAASDIRIRKRSDLENAQTPVEREESNRQRAVASMARSLAAALEPGLFCLLDLKVQIQAFAAGSISPSKARIFILSAIHS